MKLELDEQEAFFLDHLLEVALEKSSLFMTNDENDVETFDFDFHDCIKEVQERLMKLRGL